MNPAALYTAMSGVHLPAVTTWLLFTLAGAAFAWGGSGIAATLAEHRRSRPAPVVFLVPGDGEWLAFAGTREQAEVPS